MNAFQIVSDLHIEFWESKLRFNFIKPSAPILCLLGDICCLGSTKDFELFKRFINEILPHYELIIMVSGNHEYWNTPHRSNGEITYDNTMQGIDEKLKKYFKMTSKKLHYLNNSTLTLKINNQPYVIVGSTLWSWIPEQQRKSVTELMNDYKYIHYLDDKKIRKVTSDDIAAIHMKNYKYIKSQIKKAEINKSKVIVFTHHKPYLSPSHNQNSFDVAYESDLSHLFNSTVVLWAYGHTHIADNTFKGTTQLYSNPKGYPKQKTNFDKAAKLTIK